MKKLLILMLALLCSFVAMIDGGSLVFAETTTTTTTSTEPIEASNLLTDYYICGSVSANKLSLAGNVTANETMAKIGFKDFVIQRRATTTGTWTNTNYSVSDQIGENAAWHSFSQYQVSVTGGYYYRVCATAYAKEKGWFFPKTDTAEYFSASVWVPAS